MGNLKSNQELLESVFPNQIKSPVRASPPPKKIKLPPKPQPPPGALALSRLNIIMTSACTDGKGYGPHQDAGGLWLGCALEAKKYRQKDIKIQFNMV